MRRVAGIALIASGVLYLLAYAVVVRVPIPGLLLSHLGDFGISVDPVMAPIVGLALVFGGMVAVFLAEGDSVVEITPGRTAILLDGDNS